MTKKNSRIKYLAALPAVIIMLLIFIFSSREAEESTVQSMRISYYLAEARGFFMGIDLTEEEKLSLASAIEGPVRKAAHMTEYGILTVAVWFALYFWTNNKSVLYFSTVVFCIFYAVTDEIHQLFVRGRSGQFEDVLIDAVGVIIVTGVFIYCELIKEHKNEIREK